MSKIDDGGPAFPAGILMNDGDWVTGSSGMSLRDYFAVHAPEPTQDQIKLLVESDRVRNHNDNYYNKPKRRSTVEIVWDIRYAYADAGIARRRVQS